MTKKSLIVALAISENCEREAYALRSFLECLNIQVIIYWIALPNDFIGVLSGTDLMSPIDYLILCFHGDHDAFLLSKLAQKFIQMMNLIPMFSVLNILKNMQNLIR
ncbi:hypothetical protein [Acinetobacter gerneri]|uniref:hypothetical protein n=1 Tax=Acinetobacter gerneri TaxID=202952 RepID=UPI0028AAA324|nr:hypothetical protein [Acinetobacter gerneri]